MEKNKREINIMEENKRRGREGNGGWRSQNAKRISEVVSGWLKGEGGGAVE
ncbi:hypothetical protein SESBI_34246 [Sesbania bispinosa]|nr:hypothetical protein SESBI_34246 [Sesbania bispinosa]